MSATKAFPPLKAPAPARAPLAKAYRIERRAPEAPDAAPPEARHAEIVGGLNAIAEMVRPAAQVATNVVEAFRREIAEVAKLRLEVEAVQSVIEDTKRHVASIRVGGGGAVGLDRMTGELGAVAQETEAATHVILAQVEGIEMLAGVLQSEPTLEGARRRAGEIAVAAGRVYEACNFQDLAGQRITRVMETLAFVEERVARMVELCGGFGEVERLVAAEERRLAAERAAIGDEALASGPRLFGAGDHVDQSEIDGLFD